MTDQAERGAAIVVRDLTKSYPIAGKAGTAPEGGAGAPPDGGRKGKCGARMRKHVLDGVSFTVPAGSIVSFLGHNGAGKTTLIRILSTLITADSGEVSIFSRDVKEDPAGVRAAIATTGQFAAIDENLTGRENLEFFGRLRGLDRADAAARATELLAQFSLADSASTLASAYSGGMRRRLDIAASLCVVPRLLFLDEPTTGLDPVSREELWGFIRQLRDDGMTLVLTTQYLEEAEALADHVHLLKDRRILRDEGFVTVIVVRDAKTGAILAGPDIRTRGFAEGDEVFDRVRPKIEQALLEARNKGVKDSHQLQQVIRRTLGRWISSKLRRKPMIVPMVVIV